MITDNPSIANAHLDRTKSEPLHQQLKDIVVDAINQGEFALGQLMPGERELEERFHVSRITVRRALGDLVASGYLRREPGRGTYVIRSAIDDASNRKLGTFMDSLRAQGKQVTSRILDLTWQPATDRVAQILQVAADDVVLRFIRLAFVNQRPAMLASHWLRITAEQGRALTPDVLMQMDVWDALEHRCGIFLSNGEQVLQAVRANEYEAKMLELAEGSPVMLSMLMLRDSRGQPVIYAKVAHPGELYKLHTLINR